MKFLRSVTILLITVIFLAAFAIGIGYIFSVKNVNVTLLSYEHETDSDGAKKEISEIKEEILKICRGNVIAFVDDGDIINCVDDGYIVESLEKNYPCTINLVVKQRNEVFVVAKGDAFSVYDDDGNYLKDSETLLNSLDFAPNVIIEGTKSEEDIRTAAELCKKFKEKFTSVRSTVEKVILRNAETTFAKDKVTFVLRCGIKIEVQDYPDSISEKLYEAKKEFESLTGEQKLKGTIYCFKDIGGTVTRTYNPNE